MSATITYNNTTLTTVENEKKKLNTAGTWLEDDITVEDVSSSGGAAIIKDTIDEHGGTIREIITENELYIQQRYATPSQSAQNIEPTTGYNALSNVRISAIPSTYVGSGVSTKSSSDLTTSGATVTAPAGYYSAAATKAVAAGSVTAPSSITGTAASVSTASNSVTFTKTVSVTPNVTNAGYISSGTAGNSTVSLTASITPRNSGSLTTSGATVTAPAGYYPSAATKAISSGTQGTPTASKGTVSNHSISVTPSVTNTAGYISGGTKTGTVVTVSASQLVSGSTTLTNNGTYAVTNLSSVAINVPVGDTINNQDKSVDPSSASQSVTYDNGYTGLGTVTVNAIPSTYVGQGISTKSSSSLTVNGATVTAPAGYYANNATKAVSAGTAGTPTASKGTVSNHQVSVTPSVTNTTGYITGGTKTGTAVTVTASELVSGSANFTNNGTYAVTNLSSVTINVPIGDTINNQNKTVDPSESTQYVSADSGYTGLGTVTVNGIPSTYVGSGISTKSSANLTASGATVTAPAGYYANAATKAISSGSVTAPNSITGTGASVSTGTNTLTLTKTVSVTPNVTSSGYISSGTAGNSTVSLTASVNTRNSGSLTASGATVTAPAGYYASAATKAISSGSVTAPTSITGTGANITTASSSITFTKTISVTPNVTSAGYISSGTAGNSTVSLTASITPRTSSNLTVNGSTVTAPAGYYANAATKAISSGFVSTPASTITANPTISVNSSGLITASVSTSSSITPSVTAGYISSGTAGTITVSGSTTNQLSTVAGSTITPTESQQTAVASGKYTTGDVKIAAIPSTYIGSGIPVNAATDITTNKSTVTVPYGYYERTVTVLGVVGKTTAPASITGTGASISTSSGNITLSKAISVTPATTRGYIEEGTAGNSTVSLSASVNIRNSGSLTASGATVTAPAGYYPNAATKTVSSGSAVTPATTYTPSLTVTNMLDGSIKIEVKGSGNQFNVTPTVTAGYVSSGTAGTITVNKDATTYQMAILKTSSDLTASGATVTTPAGYYANNATKAIAAGSAVTPGSTISINPTITINNNGKITASVSTSTQITPTVTAGYVSSGTAGTVKVTGTYTTNLSTVSGSTVYPTTAQQTAVASGKYTTGDIVVAPVTETLTVSGKTLIYNSTNGNRYFPQIS